MRHLAKCALLAASLLLSACVDANAVRVYGRVLRADGSPAANLPMFVWSFALDFDHRVPQIVTDERGYYDFTVYLAPRPGIDPVFTDTLTARIMDGGFSEVASLTVPGQPGDYGVPDLQLWDAKAQVTATTDGTARTTWTAAPEWTSAAYSVDLEQADPGQMGPPIWSADVEGNSFDVSPDMTEDRFANLRIHATPPCASSVACFQYWSSPVIQPVGTMVPLSRGARCTRAGADGVEQPLLGRAGGPCPLTDGVADSANLDMCAGAPCDAPTSLTVDLGEAGPVRSILLHGLSIYGDNAMASASVEISADGTTFHVVDSLELTDGWDYRRVSLDAPTTARLVRIVATRGAIVSLPEVSVF